MPYKKCPKCAKQNGVRTLRCACGHGFRKTKNKKVVKKKDCPNCGSMCYGKQCRSCRYNFVTGAVKPDNKPEEIDWKDLRYGQIIKSLVGYGPVYFGKESPEPQYLGYYGKFKVIEVNEDGITATGIQKSNRGFCFIWMNGTKKMPSGTINEPHKILLLKEEYNDPFEKVRKAC